jgi:hypothetical protein
MDRRLGDDHDGRVDTRQNEADSRGGAEAGLSCDSRKCTGVMAKKLEFGVDISEKSQGHFEDGGGR